MSDIEDKSKDKEKDVETVAERKMRQRVKRRDEKKEQDMPVSGKQVFDLEKLKEKKDEK